MRVHRVNGDVIGVLTRRRVVHVFDENAPDVHEAKALLAHGLVNEAVRLALHAQRRRRRR